VEQQQTKKSLLAEHKARWEALAEEDDRNAVRSVGHPQSDEEYEESGRADVANYIEADPLLVERLSPFDARSVLEIGCGSGRMTRTLARLFQRVVAVDISSAMLEKARAFVPAGNVTFVESNGASIDIAPGSIDLGFSYIVYQHFPSKEAIAASFASVHAALKRGGLFKVQVRGLEHLDKDHWSWGPHYSESEARDLVDLAGFRLLAAKGAGRRSFWLVLERG
jgi:SAM-dependent methyltransferase